MNTAKLDSATGSGTLLRLRLQRDQTRDVPSAEYSFPATLLTCHAYSPSLPNCHGRRLLPNRTGVQRVETFKLARRWQGHRHFQLQAFPQIEVMTFIHRTNFNPSMLIEMDCFV